MPAITETGTGAISGVVSDGRTGRPLGGAVVYLGITGRGPIGRVSRQLTDRKGRFVFRNLPVSDVYFINTSRFGYIDGGYGRKSPGVAGARISLAEGQWFSAANIPLWRPGSISGTVVDEQGEPVVGVPVSALVQVLVGGTPHLASGPTMATDDRGRYRLYNLNPGKYIVFVPSVQMTVPSSSTVGTPDAPDATVVSAFGAVEGADGRRVILGRFATPPPPSGSRILAYPPTFFPGARAASEAAPVDLDSSEDREGVDIRLELVPTSRISGVVGGPPEATANLPLQLIAAGSEELGPGSATATTVAAADGSFTFANVPDGTYTILASRTLTVLANRSTGGPTFSMPPPAGIEVTRSSGTAIRSATPGTMIEQMTNGDASYSGRAVVAVQGRDVNDVSVPLTAGVTLSGRVVIESAPSAQAQPSRGLLLVAEPAGLGGSYGPPPVDLRATDKSVAFKFTGLWPGSYVLRPLGSTVVKSIEWNGRDFTYAPFDASAGRDFTDIVITIADKPASVSGGVRDEQGAPVMSAAVIIFPVEAEQWAGYGFTPPRIRSVPLNSAGGYRSTSLPAGDYYVVAVDDSEANAWQDPKFLQAAQPLATRISVDWGESKTQDLRIVRVR